MKVKLLNDGGFDEILSHIKFPIVVNAESYIYDGLIAVKNEELRACNPDGYFLFDSYEYDVIE